MWITIHYSKIKTPTTPVRCPSLAKLSSTFPNADPLKGTSTFKDQIKDTTDTDTVSEQQVSNNIRIGGQYDIILLLGHRFSTIKNADGIIFPENGQVKEQGIHEELTLQKGDSYQNTRNRAFCYLYISTIVKSKEL